MNKLTGIIVASAVCALFASPVLAKDKSTSTAKAGAKTKECKGGCKGKDGCCGKDKNDCKGHDHKEKDTDHTHKD